MQQPSGDVRGGRGGDVEGVVGGVGAADRDPADRDRLGGGDVFVREGGTGVAAGEDITRDPVVGERHRGGGRAVVNPAYPSGRDRKGPRGDVGAGRGGGIEDVVRGVGPADGDAGDRDRLACADVLVIEGGTGVARAEDVTGDAVIADCHRGRGGAVVDLADALRRHGERPGGDVGGGRGGGVEGVVPGVGPADGDAGDRDRLGGADVLVGEARRGVARAEDVTRDAVVAERDRRGGRAVVGLVDAVRRDGEPSRIDVGAGRCGGVEGVVAGIGPADGDAGDRDRLAGADILVVEGGTGVHVGEHIS